MAQPPAKRQPVFTTIAQLRPDTSGHNLTVKVRAIVHVSRKHALSRRITPAIGVSCAHDRLESPARALRRHLEFQSPWDVAAGAYLGG